MTRIGRYLNRLREHRSEALRWQDRNIEGLRIWYFTQLDRLTDPLDASCLIAVY